MKAHPNVQVRYNVPLSHGAAQLTSKGIGLLDFRQEVIQPLLTTGKNDALTVLKKAGKVKNQPAQQNSIHDIYHPLPVDHHDIPEYDPFYADEYFWSHVAADAYLNLHFDELDMLEAKTNDEISANSGYAPTFADCKSQTCCHGFGITCRWNGMACNCHSLL